MLKHSGKRARASPCADSLNMMTMSNMSNSLVGFLVRNKGEHIMRSMNSPPVTAVSQTRTSFFHDEDHYLIELDPQHINDHGRVKMA